MNIKLFNALKYKILHNPTKDVCMMLFVAGERLDGLTVRETDKSGREKKVSVPIYLLFKDLKFHLKHLCREEIRKHLLDLDPHKNLFLRVPQLPIPDIVIDYLLYDISIETESDDDDDDNDSKA